MKLVLIALACTLAAASASLQPGLRGVCVYTYDESFTGADLQVTQVDAKALEKLLATKEFVSKPKPITSALDFLGLLDGRCDVSLKCEKKECAKPVDNTCPAKETCPSCEKCSTCPASKTCDETTPKPVITTTPKPVITTTPKVITTTPRKVITPRVLDITTPPKPLITTTPSPNTYLPPVCTEKSYGVDSNCPCPPRSKSPNCLKPTPPPKTTPSPPRFLCTDDLVGIDARCPCTPGSKNPKCAPPPPGFKCTEDLVGIDQRCPCTPGSKNPKCAPPPPGFKCSEDLVGIDQRCPCTPGSRNQRCARPDFTTKAPTKPPGPFVTTTKPFKGPTYIPQPTLSPTTTLEPWTKTYVINTGTFRQSYTWEPFVAKGTWSPRPTKSRGTITTTKKYAEKSGGLSNII